jgi:hypothetical protein
MRNPQPFHILVLATVAIGLLAGCASFRGLGGSPEPSASPTLAATAAPTDTPLPTGTPLPTATPAPTPTSYSISHPTGAADVVLRMEQGGGFVPMEFLVTQAPQFTLYGDGTVVFRPLPDPTGAALGAALPPFLTGKMTEADVQVLLAYALDTGRLRDAKDFYMDATIADAPSTIFTVNADGVAKTVNVYALGIDEQDSPDATDRAAFSDLADRLGSFETEARAGAVDAVVNYDPEFYRVTLFDQVGDPQTPPIAWPWTDLVPVDFVSTDGPGFVKVLTREQTAKLMDVPNGGQMSIPVTAPDKSVVEFGVRPLLPDEAAEYLQN